MTQEILPKFAGLDRIEKYVPLTTKQDEADPDCRIVAGCATDPTIDHDKQMCDPSWLKTAMADYGQWANIREMHQAIAAGTAISIIPEGDAYYVTARIVDAGSVKKLDAGVLKGYSIGISHPVVIRDNKAIGGRIVGGEIIEISLVDRPCNPAAMLDSISVDKIDKVILWEKSDVDAVSKFIELHKGEMDEFTDAQMMLTAANIVRRMMMRELAEGADPAEPIGYTMQTLGNIYDSLLCISREEMAEAARYAVQAAVAPITMTQTTQEATMTDQVKVMSPDDIKAFLPELEKALSKGDRVVLTKAHDMISDLCNKGDTCKTYIDTWATAPVDAKTVVADATKHEGEPGHEHEPAPADAEGGSTDEPNEEPSAPSPEGTEEGAPSTEVTAESIAREQTATLIAQLEAVQSKLADVEKQMGTQAELLKVLGDQPDDSNAPFLQTLQANLTKARQEPEMLRLRESETRLNTTIETHPDGIVRMRAMADLRKVRAQIKEKTNV